MMRHFAARVSGPRRALLLLSCLAAPLLLALTVAAQPSVTTQHNDNARTGANLHETVLTVNSVKSNFGKLFELAVDGDIYAQPLYVSKTDAPKLGRNVVYVATMANKVYAFDADQMGSALWKISLGPSVSLSNYSGSCPNAGLNIRREVGIVSTPVISTTHHTLYVVAFTKTGTEYRHYLHALDLSTGLEKFNRPTQITAEGFSSKIQNQRAGLLLANDTVYVTFGSYGDCGDFHGWVFGFNAATLEPLPRVFNTTPNPASGRGGGIWQAGQGPAADAAGNLYVMSGNGTFQDISPLTMPANKTTFDRQVMGDPAAINIGGQLLLAWTARRTEDPNQHLMMATTDATRMDWELRLRDTSLDGPALALGNGRTFLAWTDDDRQRVNGVYLRSSLDFKVWAGEKIRIPGASSESSPALAFGNGRLFVAWTDKSRNVIVWSSADNGKHWDDSDKFTLSLASTVAPQLAFIDDELFLLWTGTDQRLNIMRSEDGKTFRDKITLKGWRSRGRPALFKEGAFWLAWTDYDRSKSLQIVTGRTLKDLDGSTRKPMYGATAAAPALVTFNGGVYMLWTGYANNFRLNIAPVNTFPSWGNSFVKLRPDLSVADWFTPWNTPYLNGIDGDLGSSGPLLLPGTDLVIGGGKEGKLYLLRRNNLGGFCSTCKDPNGDTQIVQWFQATTKQCAGWNQNNFPNNGCREPSPAYHSMGYYHIHGSPVYWDGPGGPFIYVWGEAGKLRRFKFENGKFVTTPITSDIITPTRSMPGAMLSLSANGSDRATSIIWASHPTGYTPLNHDNRTPEKWPDTNVDVFPGTLRAIDASTLQELWNSDQRLGDKLGNVAKFTPVTIANGKVYAATFSNALVVYGLKQ